MKAYLLAATGIIAAVSFALLGQWQLRRAAEHDELDERFVRGGELVALDVLPESIDNSRYRRVALAGHYEPRVQVLLDNMTHAGSVGYQVLTLFVSSADGAAAVVNRGWVPASPDRSVLPHVDVEGDERRLQARIADLQVPGLRLSADAAVSSEPLIVMSFPRAEDLERVLGRPIRPYQLLLDASAPDGYLRAWEPSAQRADRNRAYAAQWFFLALALFLGMLGFAVRATLRREGKP